MENIQLKQLLNSTYQNLTVLGTENNQLKLHLTATLDNFTLLSAENTQLNLFLNNITQENTQLNLHLENPIQEKRQLDVENQKLNMFLNSTPENFNLIEEEKKQLNLHLNESLKIITHQGAESKQLHRLLLNEQLNSMQLKAANEHQLSILFSDEMGFIWRFCNRDTPQCSRCLPGWTEHTSRCFILFHETKKWEKAHIECLDYGGDLAMVWNKEDQAFLTNMTFQYVQQNPSENFHSAWIGLQDMVKEGTFFWVNGEWNVIYWMDQEPNNIMAAWDTSQAGQDCVAIVPPTRIGAED
ncbi:Galactose-specific lectin nattectin [Larimichthys crocea]|uniref:Galactose-specific lectin nattectin n=1 Tax=Larimichthys crocea TaxID=215358 RepID=A0A6G0J166_LARCR|nr:Galactose-specific lectin nattectin [Larimichthys crocea]